VITIHSKYTKEEFYNEILRIYDKQHIMNTNILNQYNTLDINPLTYLTKYGGIRKICEELNIKYVSGNRNDPEDIKQDFMRVYETYGHIDIEFYVQHGKYSKTGIAGAFGNVNNLMTELGIPLNMVKKYTREDVIKDIQEFYNKYHTTSSIQYRKHGHFSESCITKMFPSWGDAIKESGIEYIPEKTYTKERMIADLQRLYDKYGFISRAMINDECEYTYEAVSFRFHGKNGIANAIGHPDAFNFRGGAKSNILRTVLNELYDVVIPEYTWDWLINPETGKHLYVDYYIPEINYAIEYDGEQHDRFREHIHGTYEEFVNMQHRDRLKNLLLHDHGIKLVRIYHSEKITKEHIQELINT